MEKTTPLSAVKHQNRQSDYESLEKHILSVYHSGVYVSSHDLVVIGKELDYDLPLKERDILLRKMLGDAKVEGKLSDLLGKLALLLKRRAQIYTQLGNEHIEAREVISGWLHKAKATDLLIKREAAKAQYE
ncbi:MAG: hypothetical protein U9Q90_04945 [Campylobacterota bacterium]|nr:hypothetical protein [Campylobacterota bacterium]